jgi:hypothetical protein
MSAEGAAQLPFGLDIVRGCLSPVPLRPGLLPDGPADLRKTGATDSLVCHLLNVTQPATRKTCAAKSVNYIRTPPHQPPKKS